MSDVGWGSDHLEPPKKRTIPLWIFGCAGGCMFMVGAAVVAAYFFVPKAIERWEAQSKPEVQWPRLSEALPFTAQPAGFTIEIWPVPFIDIWQLDSIEQDLTLFVVAADGAESKGLGKWLSDPNAAPMFKIQEAEFENSEGTLKIQGRELRSNRFKRVNPGADAPPDSTEEEGMDPQRFERGGSAFAGIESIRGDGLALDVTQEGSEKRVLLWLVRHSAGETVSDEQAIAILEPFWIGPRH